MCVTDKDIKPTTSKTSKHTKDVGAIQKGADFVKAYALGFDVNVGLIYYGNSYNSQDSLWNV